jgi:hypothetical protein
LDLISFFDSKFQTDGASASPAAAAVTAAASADSSDSKDAASDSKDEVAAPAQQSKGGNKGGNNKGGKGGKGGKKGGKGNNADDEVVMLEEPAEINESSPWLYDLFAVVIHAGQICFLLASLTIYEHFFRIRIFCFCVMYLYFCHDYQAIRMAATTLPTFSTCFVSPMSKPQLLPPRRRSRRSLKPQPTGFCSMTVKCSRSLVSVWPRSMVEADARKLHV